MSRKKQDRDKSDKAGGGTDEDTDQTSSETPVPTFADYQCTGNVEIDFPELCALLDIRDIPPVINKATFVPEPTDDGQEGPHIWAKPCLQVESELDDHLSVKTLKIFGWRPNNLIVQVLSKMIPALTKLQCLQFWQAGLTNRMVVSLANATSLCSSLRVVTLQGNRISEQNYHLLLSEESNVAQITLRNNCISDEGARLIGAALSTPTSANKKLWSLNLAFNCIGDAGAAHIARGLRLNRVLMYLSLSNNRIGDAGAAELAAILGEFALNHEEIVERRRQLLKKMHASPPAVDADAQPPIHSSASVCSMGKGAQKGAHAKRRDTTKKDEKPVAARENPKSAKKPPEQKAPPAKNVKMRGKQKELSTLEDESSAAPNEQQGKSELVNPLLDHCRDKDLTVPGNTSLISLNLSRNKITAKPLPLFLSSLKMQSGGRGLLRLSLHRNNFPDECATYVEIQELLTQRMPKLAQAMITCRQMSPR